METTTILHDEQQESTPHMLYGSTSRKHVFILRIWRRGAESAWFYTVITPNLEKKHHCQGLTDAMAFIHEQIAL